ncbi:DUF572-domain-containing protein [Cylindrobasidium torrendii FP15055 ss-10]|uniref:DUF572-domain-containing protein n=1 Tax=Cylindrobasidium torrendii FP15055 ss-10 TaxID=1314674 RepID=A0A0D7BHE8_9AGAR|nr:DUF572-domain-containing protein [Cylindrobasidium torrendii FP15055 ss-10]
MQGFNKYYPPDFDGEKHGSLNSYRGKHALGDRARKLDQGILITRFELPFNIWCDTCNNHIGMGVRYNAEKKKVGMYYTTAIFSFRCKCHLCDGWFEIQTDPKNTRYVVISGARQKDEDWNPEENGGYAVHDTDASSSTVDPLAALEKTTSAQTHLTKVQMPRLDELQTVSERFNADPYALSSKVRKQFREVKKVEAAKRKADDLVKERYGLPSSLPLLEDDPDAAREAKELWEKEQAARPVKKVKVTPSTVPIVPKQPSGKNAAVSSLRARVLGNTAKLQPRR